MDAPETVCEVAMHLERLSRSSANPEVLVTVSLRRRILTKVGGVPLLLPSSRFDAIRRLAPPDDAASAPDAAARRAFLTECNDGSAIALDGEALRSLHQAVVGAVRDERNQPISKQVFADDSSLAKFVRNTFRDNIDFGDTPDDAADDVAQSPPPDDGTDDAAAAAAAAAAARSHSISSTASLSLSRSHSRQGSPRRSHAVSSGSATASSGYASRVFDFEAGLQYYGAYEEILATDWLERFNKSAAERRRRPVRLVSIEFKDDFFYAPKLFAVLRETLEEQFGAATSGSTSTPSSARHHHASSSRPRRSANSPSNSRSSHSVYNDRSPPTRAASESASRDSPASPAPVGGVPQQQQQQQQQNDDGGGPSADVILKVEMTETSVCCRTCRKELSRDQALYCPVCSGVAYCDQLCRKQDMQRHTGRKPGQAAAEPASRFDSGTPHSAASVECNCMAQCTVRLKDVWPSQRSFTFPRCGKSPLPYLCWFDIKDRGMWRRALPLKEQRSDIKPVKFGGLHHMNTHASEWALPRGYFPCDRAVYGLEAEADADASAPAQTPAADLDASSSASASGARSNVASPAAESRAAGISSGPSKEGAHSTAGVERELSSKLTQLSMVEGSNKQDGAASSLATSASDQRTTSESKGNHSDIAASTVNKIPRSWQDYYALRATPMSSPVSAILTFPLTVFHIVSELCANTRKKLLTGEQVTIHYLGCEQELDMLPAFRELAYLLPGARVHLIMYGPEMAPELSGESQRFDANSPEQGASLKISFHRGLYSKETFQARSDTRPDVIVGLNADLSSYTDSWLPVFFLLQSRKIPAFFSDHTEYACRAPIATFRASFDMTPTLEPVWNPFAGPLTSCVTDTFPAASNGFIFGFNS